MNLNLCDTYGKLEFQKGERQPINVLKIVENDEKAVFCGETKHHIMMDIQQDKLKKPEAHFQTNDQDLYSILYLQKEHIIIFAGSKGHLQVYSSKTFEQIQQNYYIENKCKNIDIYKIKLFQDKIVSLDQESTIKIWNFQNNQISLKSTYVLKNSKKKTLDFCILQKNRYLFVSDVLDRVYRLKVNENYQVESQNLFQKQRKNKKSSKCVYTLEADNLEENIVLGRYDGTLYKLQVNYQYQKNNNEQCMYEGHTKAIWNIKFFDDNERFITCAEDKMLIIWDYILQTKLMHFKFPDKIRGLDISLDQTFVLAADISSNIQKIYIETLNCQESEKAN